MWVLAWRNVRRTFWRSLFSAGAVGLAVSLNILLFGLTGAMQNGIFELLTRSSGHVVIQAPSTHTARGFADSLIQTTPQQRERLKKLVPQAQISAILDVPALLATQERSRGIEIRGLEASPERLAQLEVDYLLKGRLPKPKSPSEIVLGWALASSLQVDIGSTVYALASGTLGSGATEFKVVGLLDLPDKAAEGYSAYTSLFAAQELAAPERISRYEIYFPHLKRLDAESDLASALLHLKTAFPQLAVLSWREANPELAAYLALLEPYIGIFAVIFLLLAGLLIVNTLYLSVLERTKEFGVMIALGASRLVVLQMVMVESLVLVGLGGLIGGSLGVGLVCWMGQGFSLPGRLSEIYQNFGLPLILYASITPWQLFMVVVSIISTSTVAAIWPAWLAGRLQPVEAMRVTT